MEKTKTDQKTIIFVLLLVIFSGISFFAGTKYQQSKVPNFANRDFRQQMGAGPNGFGNGNGAANRQRFGGGQIMGEILSQDDKSITVKLADGSSKIILFSSNTSINKASEATQTDLKVGEKVAVFGTTNSDGSVTAQNIQLNPIFRQPNLPQTTTSPIQ